MLDWAIYGIIKQYVGHSESYIKQKIYEELTVNVKDLSAYIGRDGKKYESFE